MKRVPATDTSRSYALSLSRSDALSLPDYLRLGLDLVFIGINPGLYSAQRGHYFARSTSRFWPAFSASRLSEAVRRGLGVDRLRPEHDAELPRFGIGLSDVVKHASANAAELSPSDFEEGVPLLLEKLKRSEPRVACFHGLTAYRPFLALALGGSEPKPSAESQLSAESRPSAGSPPQLGPQPHRIGATRLYVVPNPSPANAHFTVKDQTAWYDRLADALHAR
jgi:TDG/mug DNA glycosylase family protein